MILTFIFGVFLFTACSKEEIVDENREENIMDSVINYEEMFLSVIFEDEENTKVHRIQSDGLLVDTLNDQQLLIKKGSDLMIYDLKTGSESALLVDVYNTVLSADKNVIAYEKNQGIYIMNLRDKKSVLLYTLQNERSRNFILSDNGSSLLLQTVKGNQYNNKLINQNKQVEEISIGENNDLVITRFIYFSDQKLFALGEMKKESNLIEEDETSNATDLFMIDIQNDKLANITNLKAEGKTKYLDIYGKDQLLVELTESTISDEELEISKRLKRVDMNSGRMYDIRINVEDPYSLKIIRDEKEFIWLEKSDDDINYSAKHTLKIRKRNGKVETLLSILTDIPSSLYVQDNRILFNSNGDIYIVEIDE